MINYPPSISTVKHILLSTILKRGQCKPSFMKKFYWNFLKPFVCHLRILRAINISYTQYKLKSPHHDLDCLFKVSVNLNQLKWYAMNQRYLYYWPFELFELFENYATLVHQLLYSKLASMCQFLGFWWWPFGPERAV